MAVRRTGSFEWWRATTALPTRDYRLYTRPYEDRNLEAQGDFIIVVRLSIGISCSPPRLPSHIVCGSGSKTNIC
jgi:hypothetical protein